MAGSNASSRELQSPRKLRKHRADLKRPGEPHPPRSPTSPPFHDAAEGGGQALPATSIEASNDTGHGPPKPDQDATGLGGTHGTLLAPCPSPGSMASLHAI